MQLKGKKILVTGGLGFIGAHLVKRLLEEEASVTVVARRIPADRDIAGLVKKINLIIGDLSDALVMAKALSGIELVYHLAASAPFQQHYSEERSIVDLEIMLALVKESSKANVKKIIFLSGHVVYGIPQELPISEEHQTDPVNVYGAGKLSAEVYLKQSCNLYGIKFVVIRASSCYGPGQISKGVIPNFISTALEGGILYTSKVKRDYIYIGDLVSALISASSAENRIYNIGGGKSYSIAEVAVTITTLIGKGRVEIVDSLDLLSDNVLDISSARNKQGFSPQVSLLDGLKKHIQWIQQKKSVPFFYLDFDGTLINPFTKLYALHKDLCTEFSVQAYPEDKFIQYKKSCIHDREIIKSLLSAEKLELYLHRKNLLIESFEYLQYDSLFPDSVNVIKKLREKGQVVLVTRRKEIEAVHAQLEKLEIDHLFDGVLVVGAAGGSKAQLIRDNVSFINAGSVIIGDTEDDIAAGKELGIKTIAVASGIRGIDFLRKLQPDEIVKDISEVPGLL